MRGLKQQGGGCRRIELSVHSVHYETRPGRTVTGPERRRKAIRRDP